MNNLQNIKNDRLNALTQLRQKLTETETENTPIFKEILIQEKILKDPSLLHYKDFHEKVARIVEKSDEFERLTEKEKIIGVKVAESYCPLTRQKIREKWVGECGHVFERTVLVEYLGKGGGRSGCPVDGCGRSLVEAGKY